MFWLIYVMVNILNVLLWFECGHGDVCATGQCHRRLRFSSDADIVRLTNARIIIIIIVNNPLFHSNSHILKLFPSCYFLTDLLPRIL